jgi:hypothetical protein
MTLYNIFMFLLDFNTLLFFALLMRSKKAQGFLGLIVCLFLGREMEAAERSEEQ